MRAEGFFVEQSHGAATQANLVGASLQANGPTHLAVPAAPERHYGNSSEAGCNDSGGPPPAGFLEFFEFFLLNYVGHRISAAFVGLLLNHRTNQGRGQNLKGRRSGLAIPVASVALSKAAEGRVLKDIAVPPQRLLRYKLEFWLRRLTWSRVCKSCPLLDRLKQERQRAFRQAPSTMNTDFS
jgi:hypothetical protein